MRLTPARILAEEGKSPNRLTFDVRPSSVAPMGYIRVIEEDEAEGELAREYSAARTRAGKIFNVVKIQSLRPEILRASTDLYLRIMYGTSGLSRAEREMLAVVVSQANDCHY